MTNLTTQMRRVFGQANPPRGLGRPSLVPSAAAPAQLRRWALQSAILSDPGLCALFLTDTDSALKWAEDRIDGCNRGCEDTNSLPPPQVSCHGIFGWNVSVETIRTGSPCEEDIAAMVSALGAALPIPGPVGSTAGTATLTPTAATWGPIPGVYLEIPAVAFVAVTSRFQVQFGAQTPVVPASQASLTFQMAETIAFRPLDTTKAAIIAFLGLWPSALGDASLLNRPAPMFLASDTAVPIRTKGTPLAAGWDNTLVSRAVATGLGAEFTYGAINDCTVTGRAIASYLRGLGRRHG